MKLINIGFGNMVNADRVIAVVSRILHPSNVLCRTHATKARPLMQPMAAAPAR